MTRYLLIVTFEPGAAGTPHLLERAGDLEGAAVHCRAASRLATSVPERDYLATQAARLGVRTAG